MFKGAPVSVRTSHLAQGVCQIVHLLQKVFRDEVLGRLFRDGQDNLDPLCPYMKERRPFSFLVGAKSLLSVFFLQGFEECSYWKLFGVNELAGAFDRKML